MRITDDRACDAEAWGLAAHGRARSSKRRSRCFHHAIPMSTAPRFSACAVIGATVTR
jgi:hypothetical protein